jgi:hypothetical protein
MRKNPAARSRNVRVRMATGVPKPAPRANLTYAADLR